jgi:asparagine synthetase B (glutamine-hydrolysing)
MCWIAGVIASDLTAEVRIELANQMIWSFAYRGPDDPGVWAGDAGIALWHRGLAFIDISPADTSPCRPFGGICDTAVAHWMEATTGMGFIRW